MSMTGGRWRPPALLVCVNAGPAAELGEKRHSCVACRRMVAGRGGELSTGNDGEKRTCLWVHEYVCDLVFECVLCVVKW